MPPRPGKESSDDAERRKAERDAAKLTARAERDAARQQRTVEKQAARAERAAARAEADATVAAAEAEQEAAKAKEPKKADPVVPPPPSLSDPTGGAMRRRIAAAGLVLGALGLVCSVILAVGALLAAVEADATRGVVGVVTDICDVLVGPLGGVFEFSGDQAASKADLVSRGIASMLYLVVGLSLPSLVRLREH